MISNSLFRILVGKNEYNVGLIRGRKGRVQIMRHLLPQEQISVMHEIFRILGLID